MSTEKLFQSIKECLEREKNARVDILSDLKNLEKTWSIRFYSSLLKLLTHLDFTPEEAKKHWEGVVKNKENLTEKLGRDPGLMVSILDYFVNVDIHMEIPKIIELSLYEETEKNALLDGLTGLFNHRYFKKSLEKSLEVSARYARPVSVILYDIDDFKKYNDTFGHLNGDKLLMTIAGIIKINFRPSDIIARYGGEEFGVILPETDKLGALSSIERSLKRICSIDYKEKNIPVDKIVTVSCGIASFPIDAKSIDDLINCADKALYQSKFEGKNKVTLYSFEKRRDFRVDMNKIIQVEKKIPAKRTGKALLTNISASGAAMEFKRKIPNLTEIKIIIEGNNQAERVEIAGKIVWGRKVNSERYLTGIKFLQLDNLAKEKIIKIVEDGKENLEKN